MNQNSNIVFRLRIGKLNCASCVSNIESRLKKFEGIVRSNVNFATGHSSFEIDPLKITQEQIIHEIYSLGYTAEVLSETRSQKEKETTYHILFIRALIALILTLPFLIQMMHQIELSARSQITLATCVQIIGGWPFYVGSWWGLRKGSLNMDILVALGTTTAYFYSLFLFFQEKTKDYYFETSSALIAFILIGKLLEMRSKRRADIGMRALISLQPKTARIRTKNEYIEIPIEKLSLEEIVLLRPGERSPVDGVIVSGLSNIDESMLTGESFPVQKQIGDQIYTGTINLDGVLEIKTIHIGPDTALGHIIQLVEDAQNSKAPIQRLVDKVSSIFVPCILAVSLMTWILWWIIGGNFIEGLINAVAVLVISCPCALGLATPIVIMVASAKAAREGLLVKDVSVFEQVKKLEVLIVDKTGTVTEGQLKIEEFVVKDGIDQTLLLSIGRSLSQNSDHPASKAIVSYAKEKNVKMDEPATEFRLFSGLGVSAYVKGIPYYLGSVNFLKSLQIDFSHFAHSFSKELYPIVTLSSKTECLGYFVLSDQIRKDAALAVSSLKELGLQLYLISGDKNEVTAKIATMLSFDGSYGEVLPQDKAKWVEKFKKSGKFTGMVGDGINDAPALKQADISFAISSGTDVAMESSSVILMQPSLMGIVKAVKLGRVSFKKIRQNLIFAFGYNILGIPLAAFGFLNPIIAGIAMSMSSLCVVINALALNRFNLTKNN